MKFIVMIAGAIAIANGAAWAGQEGHGGRVLRCQTGTSQNGQPEYTYEVLDYYIAEHEYHKLTIDLSQGMSPLEKIKTVLDRVARLDPDRAAIYWGRAQGFMARVTIDPNATRYDELRDMSGTQAVPVYGDSCRVLQVINRIDPEADDAEAVSRFEAAGKTWSELPAEVVAGVILHEIAYGDATYMQHQYADNAMAFNAWMASKELQGLDAKGWSDLLTKLDMGYYSKHYLVYSHEIKNSGKPVFSKDGRLLSGVLVPSLERDVNRVNLAGTNLYLRNNATFYGDGSISSAYVWFWREVKFTGGAIPQTNSFARAYLDHLQRFVTLSWKDNYDFSDYRDWRFLADSNGPEIDYDQGGRSIKIHRVLTLSPEGDLLLAAPARDEDILMADGKLKHYDQNDVVAFNKDRRGIRDGIYSMTNASHYVGIERRGSEMGFRWCSYEFTEPCSVIGAKEFYRTQAVKKHLKTTMRGDGGTMAAWVTAALVLVPPTAGVLIAPAAFPLGVGAGGFVDTPFIMSLSDTDPNGTNAYFDFFNRRALKHQLFSGHYVATEVPIEQVKTELEQSLAKIQ